MSDSQDIPIRRNTANRTQRTPQNPQNDQSQNQSQEQPQQPQQGSMFSSIWKFILIYFVMNQILGFIMSMYKGKEQPTPEDKVTLNTYVNLLRDGQEFNLTAYISNSEFFEPEDTSPVWSLEGLTYDYNYTEYPEKNVTINIPTEVAMNKSKLFLHVEIRAKNEYHLKRPLNAPTPDVQYALDESSKPLKLLNLPYLSIWRTIPLVHYMKPHNANQAVNLLTGEATKPKSNNPDDKKLFPHLKSLIYIYLIHDKASYRPAELQQFAMINYPEYLDFNYMYYEPTLLLNDFWILKEQYIRLNHTEEAEPHECNVTLKFEPYWLYKYMMMHQFLEMQKKYEDFGIAQDPDDMKYMIMETNLTLLIITSIVSFLHTIFDILAYKNDIQFWRKAKTVKGISVKTIFVQLIMTLIILLYLMDSEETSMLIIISIFVQLLIECWKITKASKVSVNKKFPYIHIEDKESYASTPTKKYDTIAIKYMSYILFPLFVCYIIYSFIYEEHKGWYSFIVGSLVGGVYTFGFITMTPQLYINYKLKSVENLPWRTFIYKFLNTIIDDLFAFIIKMPIAHRISCFRDDIIFVIYLYQRWVYKVDSRRNEFGEFDEDQVAVRDPQSSQAQGGVEMTNIPPSATSTNAHPKAE